MDQQNEEKVESITQVNFSIINFKVNAITCRDAPSLYEVTPERTLKQLWEDKVELSIATEKEPDDRTTIALARNLFEREFITKTPVQLMSCFCQHAAMNFLRAEMDGADFEAGVFARIVVVPNQTFMNNLKIGMPMTRHMKEIQHQFLVAGIEKGYLVYTVDGSKIEYIRIPRDEAFLSNHVAACIDFWDHVRRGAEPTVKGYNT